MQIQPWFSVSLLRGTFSKPRKIRCKYQYAESNLINDPGYNHCFRDGGETWRATYTDTRPDIFLDAFDFWSDDTNGLVFGDAIDGRITVLRTSNQGDSWEPLLGPEVDQGGFAASGTCINTPGKQNPNKTREIQSGFVFER